MELTLRAATKADASLLGAMNRQLADDERSRNNWPVDRLAARMQEWLDSGWQAVLFEKQATPLGYSVFQIGSDYYEPAVPEVYIRQFFITRERRSQGVGRRAFQLLVESAFPPGAIVHLDVLATNPRGQRFWESLGFQSYSTAMRLSPNDKVKE